MFTQRRKSSVTLYHQIKKNIQKHNDRSSSSKGASPLSARDPGSLSKEKVLNILQKMNNRVKNLSTLRETLIERVKTSENDRSRLMSLLKNEILTEADLKEASVKNVEFPNKASESDAEKKKSGKTVRVDEISMMQLAWRAADERNQMQLQQIQNEHTIPKGFITSEVEEMGAQSGEDDFATNKSWSEEWKAIGLGARLPKADAQMTNLLFVQTGFGVDQHGDRTKEGATKAAVRAVRNAIEFNSIPGIIETVPGGRAEMLIHVKLGVPPKNENATGDPMNVDLSEIAKVFPYGRLMPMEVVVGGLKFPTGRIVRELGDNNDIALCVVASVSVGYDSGDRSRASHTTHDTSSGV